MATTRPPRVMVLMPRPKAFMNSRPINSDRGIALRVMIAVRQFIKNSSMMIETMMMPSINDLLTLPMAESIKLAWRKVRAICTSAGKVGCRLAITASTARVTVGVSTSGCLLIISTMADCPLKLASPRFRAAPVCTSATSCSRIGSPFSTLTTDCCRSAIDCTWPRPRTSSSCPPPIKKPPGALEFAPWAASVTSLRATLRALSCSGFTKICSCRSSPP